MFKRIIGCLFISLFSVVIASCSGGGSSGGATAPSISLSETVADGGWTIMVWLDGDNNLESAAMEDINEMEYGLYQASLTDPQITDKVKIIVQVDRCGYVNDYGYYVGYDENTAYTGENWTGTRIYIIRPDSANSVAFTSERIDQNMNEVNMGSAANLKTFINNCKDKFEADNYSLILWNHGGGLYKKSSSPIKVPGAVDEKPSKEICIDETNGDDALYIGEIADTLTDTQSVKFLGFDACLMGMLEVAYEFRPGETGKFSADAICFSPASEQGDGWNYVKILTRLKGSGIDAEGDICYDSVALTANQFATLCAKEYADDDGSFGSNNFQTQTAIDNTQVVAVKTAMDNFAVALKTVPGYKSLIETIRGNDGTASTMHYFNAGSEEEWMIFPFFDLYDFAERVYNGSASLNNVDDEATELMTAVKALILYSYGNTTSYSGFTNDENGVSFFFSDGDDIYEYDDEGDIYYIPYLMFEYGYTSLNVSADDWYYGRLDFCEKGLVDGEVENWYELMMDMYMTPSLLSTGYWPSPAY